MRNLKKILALVLALAMSMSLVTIANAADFTDEKDISYEEAVDVMNAIGVIEGLDTGAFNPSGTLTREQAAAIICRMMLGVNADKLGTTGTTFSDVAATRWSASYINYCASLGIIAGNGDGTYNPTGTLTGYAFAKMLLGALGYKADVEGFVGAGWNLKVASMASKAGLLNDLVSFVGSNAITREEAAQMALNTLKATLVEYNGTTIDVSTGDATVSVGNTQYSYVVSNNGSINQNIGKGNAGNQANYYTLEFGEQHFPNLKLVSTGDRDSFGRPANTWSLSNIKIGTYGKTPDYVYTARAAGETLADKVKDMGIKDYTVGTASACVNGKDETIVGATNAALLQDIADYTNNGTVVEIFMSETNANVIAAVVVVKTQIMKVDRINASAKTVTLKQVESTGEKVLLVEDDNACYEELAAMTAGDLVLVVPVTGNGGASYEVASVSVPTTDVGSMSKVTLNAKRTAVTGVTVNGTAYGMSEQWTSADKKLNTTTVPSSKVQTTVYLDNYGYVIYAKDVEATSDYMIYDETYSSLVDGKIVYYATGWDLEGNAVSLNFGTVSSNIGTITPGTVKAYASTTTGNAEYAWDSTTQANAVPGKVETSTASIAAGATKVTLGSAFAGKTSYYFASDVKFIFVTKDGTDVTGVTVKDGVQKISENIPYTVVLKADANATDGYVVSAVVVSNDNDVAVGADLLYISKAGSTTLDENGKVVSVFDAYIDGVLYENCVSTKNNAIADRFYTYAVNDNGTYVLQEYKNYADKATSVLTGANLAQSDIEDGRYINTITSDSNSGTTTATGLNALNAEVIDLTGYGTHFSSLKEMDETTEYTNYKVSLIYNDADVAAHGTVSYIFVTDATAQTYTAAESNTVTDTENGITATMSSASKASGLIAGQEITYTVTLANNATAEKTMTLTFTAGANSTAQGKTSYEFEVEASTEPAVKQYTFTVTVNGGGAGKNVGAPTIDLAAK